jgi:uncharacterized membrane protein HdeD (DUF308 family)
VTTNTPIPIPGIIGLFTRSWWILLLRGIIAIIFGVLAFFWPAVTLATLVILFGVYALVDGAFSLAAAFSGWRHRDDRWLLLLEGLVGVWAGFITLRNPAITAVVLIMFISIWALAIGVLRIIAAIRLRKEITGEVWMVLSGLASILFAFLVMWQPAAGALALVWMIGVYAIIVGATLVMLGLELHRLHPRTA